MESGGRSMPTIEVVIETVDEKCVIKIGAGEDEIRIPISEDNPKGVKSAFNKLLSRIRTGLFEIELKDVGEDLFSQVAKEYVAQLNREIAQVHGEMKEHGLLED